MAARATAPRPRPAPTASTSSPSCGNGELACYDFDGKEVWKFNTQERYGKFRLGYGCHSTPVLDGDRLYLQFIHDGGAYVVALDKATARKCGR